MEFSEVTFGSPDYEHTLSLRKRILRDPLRLEWSEEEKAWEARERHFVLREEGRVIACVVARDLGENVFKLRQMAVEPKRQKAGLGRVLLERVEGLLIGEGVTGFELNARDLAVGFYEKLGYQRVGDEFVEVSIPHWKMEKVAGDRLVGGGQELAR